MRKLIKKILCISLALLLMVGALSGCGEKEAPATEPPAPTEPETEAKVLKVLTLGHSLSVDSNHMINLVAATEGIGDYEEIFIGTLYYSGCRLSQHVNFLRGNLPEYRLYLSSTKTPDSPPETMDNVTMLDALKFEYWDIIVMHGGSGENSVPANLKNGNIQTIQSYVNEHKHNPNAIFAWHMAWVTPESEELLDMYPYEPNVHKENYLKYGNSRETYYNAVVSSAAECIVTDETFQFLIPTGTAMQNAWSSYMEEKDIHRDYGHATDMARAMTSYVWYCKLMGIEKLEEIKLDAIPKAFLKSTEDKTQDRVLTQAEKAVMLESINNALANPLQMTQSQYTTPPAEQ